MNSRIAITLRLALLLFNFAWLAAPARAGYRLATFSADVTVPLGHALMGGGIAPAKEISDPLFTRGFVLLGADRPLVFVSVDWCEIRNDAYDRWRDALAEAAGTDRERVLVTSVHVHDAPVTDLRAEQILEENHAAGSVCDLDFHERAVRRVADALRESLKSARNVTHLGTGQAKVEMVASNRRFVDDSGKVSFGRMSATRDPVLRDKPEGVIDPWLKTLSFWDEDRPVAAVSFYATHPMSHYGKGSVSADFVGMARQRRQNEDSRVFQIYVSGCSGNVTAGKYNDGSPENRPVLAERIYRGMRAAWEATERHPLTSVSFRAAPLRLKPREDTGFSLPDLRRLLTSDPKPFGQCLAALGLSWRERVDAGRGLTVPVIDLGIAQLVLMPAESYVEYQILAQSLRPDCFIAVAGYGECAPGYIPTERHWAEHDTNLHDWCWVAPGAEEALTAALRAALQAK